MNRTDQGASSHGAYGILGLQRVSKGQEFTILLFTSEVVSAGKEEDFLGFRTILPAPPPITFHSFPFLCPHLILEMPILLLKAILLSDFLKTGFYAECY